MCLISVVYKGELYIFGGYNGCDDLHFGDMFKFNPGKYSVTLPLCMLSVFPNSILISVFLEKEI